MMRAGVLLSAERLRTPGELATTMSNHGPLNQEVRSLKPASPLRLPRSIHAAKRGQIRDAKLASLGMHVADGGESPVVTYRGFARRQSELTTTVFTR
jgi:hypothetical protein